MTESELRLEVLKVMVSTDRFRFGNTNHLCGCVNDIVTYIMFGVIPEHPSDDD